MNVVKRDGRTEEFDANKIHEVLFWATKDIKGVSVSDIEINANNLIYAAPMLDFVPGNIDNFNF